MAISTNYDIIVTIVREYKPMVFFKVIEEVHFPSRQQSPTSWKAPKYFRAHAIKYLFSSIFTETNPIVDLFVPNHAAQANIAPNAG